MSLELGVNLPQSFFITLKKHTNVDSLMVQWVNHLCRCSEDPGSSLGSKRDYFMVQCDGDYTEKDKCLKKRNEFVESSDSSDV